MNTGDGAPGGFALGDALTGPIAELANAIFRGPDPSGGAPSPPVAAAPDLPDFAVPDGLSISLIDTPIEAPSAATALPAEDAPYFLALAGLPSMSLPSAELGSFPTSVDAPPGFPAGPGALPVALASWIDPQGPAPSPPDQPEPAEPAATHSFEPELVPQASPPPEAPGPGTGIFDPHAVKRDFPILRERVRGRPLVWLDNAATTQKPQAVIDRLSYFYEHENSNVHRAAHTLAARATDAYEGAREKVRRFLNAPSTREIVFVRGATEGINLVAQSWGRRNVGPGDEIVITWLEHHANIVPWQMLCAEKGAKLRVAPVDSRGDVILEEYEKLLGPRTRLVSFTQVSNALGTVTPAREMIDMAHRHGARVLLDGAQAVSHMPVDVQLLGCDFYVLSGHKVFAPTGIGAVFGKSDVLDAMPPWQGGGNMIADVTFERTVYQPPPARFEAGTGNIADAVGLGAALDYLSSLGLANVSRHEHDLRLHAEGCLSQIPGLRIIGNPREKAGVVSFVLEGIRTEEVGGALDQEGIAVRSGHHCAQPILRRFGVEATVRASLAPYNTREDIDALVAAVRRLVAGTPAAMG
jgi:cysteine desulfurase/selenocysteine lyase